MRKVRGTNTGAVIYGVVVVGQVVIVDFFGRFNYLERFIGRYYRILRYLQEVGDQGFDMLQRAFFRRRRGQRVIRFERVFRYVVEVLFKNAQILAQFFYFKYYAGVVVRNVIIYRDFKVEVFIVRIRTRFTYVEVDFGSTQVRVSGVLFQRFFRVIGGNVLGTIFQNGVLQRRFFVRRQTFRYLVEEFTQQAILVARQVVRYVVNTELRRVYTEISDCFYQIVNFLTIGKGEEYWRYCVDVLNKGRDIQQVIVDAEQFGEYNANDVNAIRYGDFGQFFYRQYVRYFVNVVVEVFDTVSIRNVVVLGLAFVYFFRITVVVIDVWYVVDNFFVIEL